MSFAPERHKDDEPCEQYFGNLCSGFGGQTICTRCGWDFHDHKENKIDFGDIE